MLEQFQPFGYQDLQDEKSLKQNKDAYENILNNGYDVIKSKKTAMIVMAAGDSS